MKGTVKEPTDDYRFIARCKAAGIKVMVSCDSNSKIDCYEFSKNTGESLKSFLVKPEKNMCQLQVEVEKIFGTLPAYETDMTWIGHQPKGLAKKMHEKNLTHLTENSDI
jgi:hypothetical protein